MALQPPRAQAFMSTTVVVLLITLAYHSFSELGTHSLVLQQLWSQS